MKPFACLVCVLVGLVVSASAGAAVEQPGRPLSPAASPLDVVLNLSGRREQALAAYVRAVTDPASPSYRRYLTLRRIADRFGAPEGDRRRVLSFLRSLGLRGAVDPSGTFVSVRMPSELAEAVFSTRLTRAFTTAGRYAVRTLTKPSVPSVLADLVDGVGGLDTRAVVSTQDSAAPVATFGPGASGMPRSGTPAGCVDGQQARSPLGVPGFTPNQWLGAYAVEQLHLRGLTGDGQRLALIEIDGYLESDLAAAATCFGYTVPPLRRVLVGLEQPLEPGGETTLDLQVIAATAPGLDEIQIYQGDASLAALLLTFAAPLEQPPQQRPHVVSASLGACEPDYTDQVSLVEAGEQLFRVYAALGITVVASAGDTGSSGCALAANSSALGVLAASYPASSAYVTAVGGTNLELDAATGSSRRSSGTTTRSRSQTARRSSGEPVEAARVSSSTGPGGSPPALRRARIASSPTSRSSPTSHRGTRSTARPRRSPSVSLAASCRLAVPALPHRSSRQPSRLRTRPPPGAPSRDSASSTPCSIGSAPRQTRSSATSPWARTTSGRTFPPRHVAVSRSAAATPASAGIAHRAGAPSTPLRSSPLHGPRTLLGRRAERSHVCDRHRIAQTRRRL